MTAVCPKSSWAVTPRRSHAVEHENSLPMTKRATIAVVQKQHSIPTSPSFGRRLSEQLQPPTPPTDPRPHGYNIAPLRRNTRATTIGPRAGRWPTRSAPRAAPPSTPRGASAAKRECSSPPMAHHRSTRSVVRHLTEGRLSSEEIDEQMSAAIDALGTEAMFPSESNENEVLSRSQGGRENTDEHHNCDSFAAQVLETMETRAVMISNAGAGGNGTQAANRGGSLSALNLAVDEKISVLQARINEVKRSSILTNPQQLSAHEQRLMDAMEAMPSWGGRQMGRRKTLVLVQRDDED